MLSDETHLSGRARHGDAGALRLGSRILYARGVHRFQRDGLLEASGRELHWRPAADAEVANR